MTEKEEPKPIVSVVEVPQKIYFIGPVTIEKKDWFGGTSVEELWPESGKPDEDEFTMNDIPYRILHITRSRRWK